MKVILLDELKGKGKEGDVVEVARGFAVNYLLPNKMAVEATKGNVKQLEARRSNIARREVGRISDAEGLAGAMEGKTVVVSAKAGDEGRLFGSVTPAMIVDALGEQLAIAVDKRKLEVHGHIKTLGDHVVSVKVYSGISADVTVRVVALGAEADAAAPAPVAAAVVAAEETVAEDAVEVTAEAEVTEAVSDDADEASEEAVDAEAAE
jgi:large subunit ribosomal protein L9